jgi:hypothetical protein
MLTAFYRSWFKLTVILGLICTIVITVAWPYLYVTYDGFGIYIEGWGGYHVERVWPI